MDRRAFVGSVASGIVAIPLGALAEQQGKVWRVGFLSQSSASLTSPYTDAFLKGMRDLGYVEGKNLVVEWRFADGKLERLPILAAQLVQLKVDVIVATPSPAIAAAQKATTTIPIVMASAGDPLGSGFVKSLARPRGNITGLSVMGSDTGAKQLELLRSVVPKLTRVAVLTPYAADSPTSRSVQAAARNAGVETLLAEARTPQEIEGAFSLLVRERADAVIVSSPSTFAPQHQQIAELALKYRMPSMFQDRINADSGGLMSYGPKFTENYLRAATYVDKILKGAKPGDLPVEQPMSFEFVVNLKTARALGLAIPQAILLRADEVIQ